MGLIIRLTPDARVTYANVSRIYRQNIGHMAFKVVAVF